DVLATVADQAYLGVGSELDQGREAVAATRGIVLLWEGRVIDAFYHSTCGGRTAEPTEIFPGAGGRPYLRSISDQSPDGASWCAISPRYRWREEWTATQLAASLREGMPTTVTGPASPGGLSRLRDVVITARGSTGRVQAITIYHGSGAAPVTGANLVRQALRPVSGGMLRSSHFTLEAGRSGDLLARLVAEGQGAGHGVGMCQWGAIGRARTGASWQAILGAYFPGAVPGRLY
ncbi:MAG: SpoIID/LytB domain-containing protein, partial [Gemmatimonadales bacterium]